MTYYNSNAPRIISNGGGSRAKIHIDENTTFVTDVETSDRISTEKNGRLTYKIVGGIDRHLFEIDKKTGVLSFKNAPDFEHPTDSNRDGDYHVKVKVIDGAGYTDTQKIEVVVKDVDETPVVFDPNKIDFEADANGNRLETGQIIDNEFSGAGFTVRSSNSRKPAMIFDTANPTGDDHDLGRFPELSKVLIISEDGDSRDPDDNAGGGTLIFDFDDPRFVGDIGLLDTEEGGSIRAYDSNGNLLSTTDIPSIRNGARQDVGVDTGNVSRLEVHLDGSGAIAHLCIEEDINEAPHANDDSASVDAGEMVVIDVLGNDTDPDGDDLTIDNVGNPDNGTVEIVNGEVKYTPNDGFTGMDTFDYTISDGNGGEDTATVKVTVNDVNEAPHANDDSASVDAGEMVVIDVLGNDTDPDGDDLTIDNVGNPDNGTVEIVNGEVKYTPNDGFAGADTFEYTISDGNGGTDTATVTVDVNEVGEGAILDDGCYQLGNHILFSAPGPDYGLRLDGLLTGDQDDVFTFDFEDPHSDMRLSISDDGSTIRIFGTVFGGLVDPLTNEYDPDQSGLWEVDFTYDNQVTQLEGDDDFVVDASFSGNNSGTITQLFGDGGVTVLKDFAGRNDFTFQLGDTADDSGFRGFDGSSGWGWLTIDDNRQPLYDSDWLFTVQGQLDDADCLH